MSELFKDGRGRTALFLAGCLALFLGERMLMSWEWAHRGAAGLAALLVAASLLLRFRSATAGPAGLRAAERPLLFCHLSASLALGLYAIKAWKFDAGGAPGDASVALAVGWPIFLAVALAPLLLMERAISPMRRAGEVDSRRVREALRGGLSLGLAVSFLFVANLLATRHDEKADLAYFRTARPGTAAIALVERLEEPVDVVLFFPRANDVLEQVRAYFAVLEGASEHIRVKVADRLLNPVLAREHQVRQDGTIVIAREKKRDRWRIGLKLRASRRDLAKLDAEFQKRMTKVISPQRIAYTVTGHGELNDPEREGQKATKARDRAAREILGLQGYQLKNLGLSQGLGAKVPEDAGVVLALGPRRPMLPAEEETLLAYVQGGGRLLLAVEPDSEATPDKLLAGLGLQVGKGLLTHDRIHLVRRRDLSDRQLLVTASFSSHPSVKTLSRDARHIAVALDRAGHLERKEGPEGAKGRSIQFTIRSMTDTWADLDGDRQFTEQLESRKVRQIAAAVTFPAAKGKGEDKEEEAKEGRAVVLADSDALSDDILGNRGNLVLLSDAMRWLQGEEELAGTTESEEDVPVEHTSKEDAVWFHGTVLALPLLILLPGLTYVRRRRRRRQA